jgi:predicted nucleotidyltransferase
MVDAENMICKAVDYCIREAPGFSTADEVIRGLNSGNLLLNSKLRQSIARDVAGYLSERFGGRIKAARLYGSAAEYNAGVFSDIDLVFLVTELPESFRQVVADMDKILSGSYCRLLGRDEGEWSYLLDVHVINEDPLEKRHPSRAYLENIFMNESVAVN